MPQPLSHVHPTLGYVLAAGNAPHSPAMAVATLAVINLWSQIDYNYGALVATIGKTDPETVTAVFQSMVSGEAKRDAVLAAARTSLAPEQASLIAAVIESTKPSRKTRNDFAHHLWGALHGRDDCVILVHPKTLAKYTAKMFSWAQRPNDPRPDLDRGEVMVWTQPDFDSALQAAIAAHDRTVQLTYSFDHPAADHRRQSLLADPQIKRLYNRLLQENNP